MNRITGEVDVRIEGKTYYLRFDWNCLAAIEEAHGDSPNLFNPDVVASIAAIGFRRKHPDMTPERIKELSPPLMPFAASVQQALQWAYFGLDELPEESTGAKKKTGLRRLGFWKPINWPWRKESTPSSSGA